MKRLKEYKAKVKELKNKGDKEFGVKVNKLEVKVSEEIKNYFCTQDTMSTFNATMDNNI